MVSNDMQVCFYSLGNCHYKISFWASKWHNQNSALDMTSQWEYRRHDRERAKKSQVHTVVQRRAFRDWQQENANTIHNLEVPA